MSAITVGNKGKHTTTAIPPKRTPSKMATGESLNHLLNFTLPPRQSQPPQSASRRSKRTVQSYTTWNREKFINAQYRFVMNPLGDYTVHFADPDIYFQWNDILQVISPRYSALAAAVGRHREKREEEGIITCPICLSPPTAPRMTKCGHIFCFPCVLHYLSISDLPRWHRCPICLDAITDKQLKCVKWFDEESSLPGDDTADASSSSGSEHGDSPKPGSILNMRLIERQQISTLALPRSKTWPSDLLPPHQAPFYFLPDVFRFARFMVATPEYLLEHLSRDLDELAAERLTLDGQGDDLTLSFVVAAETKVRRQMEKAAALETGFVKDAVIHALQELLEVERRHAVRNHKLSAPETQPQALDDRPEEFLATQQHGFVTPASDNAVKTNNRRQRPRRNVNPPPPSTSTYYYYQAASGAPIFLHPLDIRILLSHFESYSAFPDTLSVRVEAIAEGSINDDLRRRYKYLAHLPESADVVFVEADLANIVGSVSLQSFEAALRTRRTKRREKERKDDRARVRGEEREREKMMGSRLVAPTSFVPDFTDVVAEALPERPSSPDEILVDESSADPLASAVTQLPTSSPTQRRDSASGAWGQRSFASALHSAPRTAQRTRSGQGRAVRDALAEDAEWELEAAWNDLDISSSLRGSGGRGQKKQGRKLVVLGGVGGRRR